MDRYYRQISDARENGGPWPELPPLPSEYENSVSLGTSVTDTKIYYWEDDQGRPISGYTPNPVPEEWPYQEISQRS